jgi:hypothetical protein
MFEEQKQTQPINQRMLDSVMTGTERQKDYGLRAGGKVKKGKNIDRALSLTSMYAKRHDRDAG